MYNKKMNKAVKFVLFFLMIKLLIATMYYINFNIKPIMQEKG